MKTELKTLEDLKEGKYMLEGLVRLDHLREEAVKWIKKANELNDYDFGTIIDENTIEWIKVFFNLADEDLVE